jgi:fatty acid synthase subunit alpha
VDGNLEQFDYIVYPSRSIQTDGIKAFSVTSFGFGQKGAQAIGIHPKYLFATLDEASYRKYASKVEGRQKKAYRYFHNSLITNAMFVAKDNSPYTEEQMSSVFLNPDARVSADKKTHALVYPPLAPAKNSSKSSTEGTRQMMESLARGAATANAKVGVDVEEVQAINIENETFIERNFTTQEIEYCHKAASPQASFAGKWSAKEAVFKSLGVAGKGGGAPLKEIEIINDEKGAPLVNVSILAS